MEGKLIYWNVLSSSQEETFLSLLFKQEKGLNLALPDF
jgi:hypothetical protein